MSIRKFNKKEALLFSMLSVVAGFARFIAIKDAYGDIVFREYTLWLPIVLCLSELLNLFADTSKHSKVMLTQSQMHYVILASAFAVVGSQGLCDLIAVTLVLYSNLDSALFVEVAKRSCLGNMLLLTIRVLSVVAIYFAVPYGLAGLSLMSLFILYRFGRVERVENMGRITISRMNIALTTVFSSRVRDWLNTLLMQRLLPVDGYFWFYFAAKAFQNISGLTYLTIRSTNKIDAKSISKHVAQYFSDVRLLLATVLIGCGAVAIGFGSWLYISTSLIENLACQLLIFSYDVGSKIMMANIFGVFWSFCAYLLTESHSVAEYAWLVLVIGSIVNVFYFSLRAGEKENAA